VLLQDTLALRLDMTLLHLHTSQQPIITLLTPHLPFSLSTLQPLTTPGSPLTLYSTLDPTSTAASDDDGRIVLVDLGNQLRFYHSYEKRILEESKDGAKTAQKRELIQEGEELVEKVIRDFLTNHQEGREGELRSLLHSYQLVVSLFDFVSPEYTVMKIGSISDVWSKAIERATGIPAEGETRTPRYRIWFDPSIRDTTGRLTPERGNVQVDRIVAPEGMEFREAKEEDIPIVSLPALPFEFRFSSFLTGVRPRGIIHPASYTPLLSTDPFLNVV